MENLFRGRFLYEAFRYVNGQERIDLHQARARQKLDNLKLYGERQKLETYKLKMDMIVNQVILPSIIVLGFPICLMSVIPTVSFPIGMFYLSLSVANIQDAISCTNKTLGFICDVYMAGPNPADLFWYYQFYILLSAHDLITASYMCYPLKLHEYYFNTSALVLILK